MNSVLLKLSVRGRSIEMGVPKLRGQRGNSSNILDNQLPAHAGHRDLTDCLTLALVRLHARDGFLMHRKQFPEKT